MKRLAVDWYAMISYIAGGGLAAAAVGTATLVPHYQTQILAISAIGVGVAGLVTRAWKNPTAPTPPNVPTEPPKGTP